MESKNFTITQIGDIVLKQPMPFIFVEAKGVEFMFQADDLTVHMQNVHQEIRFTKNFYLCAYLCTQEFWQAVVSQKLSYGIEINPSEFKGNTRPVDRISWNQVQQFIGLLNRLFSAEKLKQKGNIIKMDGSFNLPSEVQWEYAARAGGTFLFAGSNQVQDVAWYNSNNELHTMPVGLKKPNAWGLYDMSGNVWEWCANNFEHLTENANAGSVAKGDFVSLRGGSFGFHPEFCRLRYRSYGQINGRRSDFGFRLLFAPSSSTA